MFHLVVTMAFGSYAVGDRITDQLLVAELPTTHPGYVVRVTAPEEPAKAEKAVAARADRAE